MIIIFKKSKLRRKKKNSILDIRNIKIIYIYKTTLINKNKSPILRLDHTH